MTVSPIVVMMAARWICLFALATGGFAATPTFSKDVALILFEHCAVCHRSGEIGPMPLLTYEQARPWAKAIRSAIALGKMPPWPATQPRGVFSNDRRLSDHDRETLLAWVAGGAPQGDPKDLPAAPDFDEGWKIGKPDVVLTMPKAVKVPAWGSEAYQYIKVPTHFTEDRWVQSIELRPGARRVVHHVLVACGSPGEDTAWEDAFNPVGPETTILTPAGMALIAVYISGTDPTRFPAGSALRIKAGSVLTLGMHYNASGEPAEDVTSVGMIFAKEPPRREMHISHFANPHFVLRPGDPHGEVDSAIEFTQDAHIWALLPHTHLRGKSWEYRTVYPDGRREAILSLPNYDPNWQTYYEFATPLAVPKGARIEAVARYDNSENNPSNPDPRVEVRWGEQAWQEMQFSGISYTVDGQAGESTGVAVAQARK